MILTQALTALHGVQCALGVHSCDGQASLESYGLVADGHDSPVAGHILSVRDKVIVGACGHGGPKGGPNKYATQTIELPAAESGSPDAPSFAQDTRDALAVLQHWYNIDNGLWHTTGWWNGANCLTVLASYATIDERVKENYTSAFQKTWEFGPMNTLMFSKKMRGRQTHQVKAKVVEQPKEFLNGFYDDEGWWGLAWVKVYDVTKESKYLATAAHIYEDMLTGNSTCGGIWWDKGHSQETAVSNELFLHLGAALANRADALANATTDKSYFLSRALKHWDWFQKSGMINEKGNINDGLTRDTCKNNGGIVWSYTQGIVLSGLMELHAAAPNDAFVKTALSIAHAAIDTLAVDGILVESCEKQGFDGECTRDSTQFKGVFMRGLAPLWQASKDQKVKEFVERNAKSILEKGKSKEGEFGLRWGGPAGELTGASTHSSALDALVAAVAIGGR